MPPPEDGDAIAGWRDLEWELLDDASGADPAALLRPSPPLAARMRAALLRLAQAGQSEELGRALGTVWGWGWAGLPAPARAELSAALAASTGTAPRAAARALAALPPDGGIHYTALLRAQAARRSAQGVRVAFAAAAAGLAGRDENGEEEGGGGFFSTSPPSSYFAPSSPATAQPAPYFSHAERKVWLEAVSAFGAIGRPASARRVWEAGLERGMWTVRDTQPLNTFLNALSGSPGGTEAAYAAALASGATPDLVTHNIRLKAAMRAADAGAAEAVLKDLRARGLRGDEFTFNTAIKAFSYAGDVGRALGVRADMAAAGVPPTASVWGSLLVAAGRGGAPASASALWAEMSDARVDPGLDGRHALLQACAYGLRFEEALAVLADAKAAAKAEAAGGASAERKKKKTPPPPPLPPSSSPPPPSSAPTTLTYNLIIKAAGPAPGARRSRAGAAEALARCGELLDEMLGGGERGGGGPHNPNQPAPSPKGGAPAAAAVLVPPDAATFTGLFTLAEEACDGRTAAALYARMRRCGVKEDAVACGALFGALGAGAAAAFRRGGGGGGSAGPRPAPPPAPTSAADAATAAALAAAASPSPSHFADLTEAVWALMVWGPRRLKPRPPQALAAVRCLLDCGRPASAARVAAGAGARLPPRDLDRLTQAVADVAAAAEGEKGGGGEGRAAAAALARLLRGSGTPPAASTIPSSSTLRLDVRDLAPAPARAAVLCALAELADGGGGVPAGGLVVEVSGGAGGSPAAAPPPPSPAPPASPPSFLLQPSPDLAAVRTSLIRLLREDLGIALDVVDGEGGDGGTALVVQGAALEKWVAGRRAKGG